MIDSFTPDLSVTIAGIKLKNPVIAASGTFGFGKEYNGLLDIASLGAICTKGLTLNAVPGNTGQRLLETPSGLLNSIGLENPGIRIFLEKELPALRKIGPAVIVNLSGLTEEDYTEGAKLLDKADIDIIELNISCPNVKSGGMAFGLDPETAGGLTKKVRYASPNKPLMVKLSPNAPHLTDVAKACTNSGADSLSLVNTFKAMAVDVYKRKPVFENITAGLSGPCIRPIALRMLWELRENINVPLVGIGGIASAEDALEFLLAGASAIQVGSGTFSHPPVMNEIITGIESYMIKYGFRETGELKI